MFSSLLVQFETPFQYKLAWPSAKELVKVLLYKPSDDQSEDGLADWLANISQITTWRTWCGWRLDEKTETHQLDPCTLAFVVEMEKRETGLYVHPLCTSHLEPPRETKQVHDLCSVAHTGELIRRLEPDLLEAAERQAYLAIRKESPKSNRMRQLAQSSALLHLIRAIVYSVPESPPIIPVEFVDHDGHRVTVEDIHKIIEARVVMDESFREQYQEYMFGTVIRLGERTVYATTNPVPLDSSLVPSYLAKPELSADQIKAIVKEEFDAERSQDQREVAALLKFGYWYQLRSPKRVNFVDKYFIAWHSMFTEKEFELILSDRRNGRPRLPIICHAGRNCWLILTNKYCVFADDPITAIYSWIYIVSREFGGQDEFGCHIPAVSGKKKARLSLHGESSGLPFGPSGL